MECLLLRGGVFAIMDNFLFFNMLTITIYVWILMLFTPFFSFRRGEATAIEIMCKGEVCIFCLLLSTCFVFVKFEDSHAFCCTRLALFYIFFSFLVVWSWICLLDVQ